MGDSMKRNEAALAMLAMVRAQMATHSAISSILANRNQESQAALAEVMDALGVALEKIKEALDGD